jgi:hypothetical protein
MPLITMTMIVMIVLHSAEVAHMSYPDSRRWNQSLNTSA